MSEWKNPDNELPPKHTQVLCLCGGRMFGAYAIGEIMTDKEGLKYWRIYDRHEYDAGYGSVNAWQ